MSNVEFLKYHLNHTVVSARLCARYRVCTANPPAAVELCARNGTLSEPRLCINGVHLKTLHSTGAGKSWKISEFYKNSKLNLKDTASLTSASGRKDFIFARGL